MKFLSTRNTSFAQRQRYAIPPTQSRKNFRCNSFECVKNNKCNKNEMEEMCNKIWSTMDSVRSKSPLMASPGLLSNSLHGSFHGSLGSDGMSCSSARSSSASPDSVRYLSSQIGASEEIHQRLPRHAQFLLIAAWSTAITTQQTAVQNKQVKTGLTYWRPEID